MDGPFHVFDIILSFGYMVGIPIFIILIAFAVRVKPGEAFRAGVTVGACLVGATVLCNLLAGNLLSIGSDITQQSRLTASIIDVGWQASSFLSSISRSGFYALPLAFFLNILLLLTKTTRTINLDLWNIWQASFIGAMVETLTGQMVYGLITTTGAMVIVLVIADNTAPWTESALGLTGLSITHGFSSAFIPITALFNWMVNLVPGVKKITLSLKDLQRVVGYAADPAPLAIFLGVLWGIVCGRSPAAIAQMAATFGAVVLLLPLITQTLVKSLIPIINAIQFFIDKKIKIHGKIYLGMSATLGLGNPTVLLLAILLTPASLYLAAILPGNRLLPGADLVMIPYILVAAVTLARGDILRSLVGGILSILVTLFCGTALAELFTQSIQQSGTLEYTAEGLVSNLCNGSSPLTWVLVNISLYGVAGMVLLVVVVITLLVWNRNRITGGVRLYVRRTKTLRASQIDQVDAPPEVLPPVPQLPKELPFEEKDGLNGDGEEVPSNLT